VPNPVVAVLGPSIGYLLAQSELCQWALTEKVRTTYQEAFKQIGMTPEQQATAWAQAVVHQKRLAEIPAEAQARMKAETCTSEAHGRFERDLSP
jgi:hypothetical protein